jgi:hypothetical protein
MLLALSVCLLIGALGGKFIEAREHTKDLIADLEKERVRVNEVETLLGGVVDRLETLTPTPWEVRGFDIVREAGVSFRYNELDIIYQFRTGCRW